MSIQDTTAQVAKHQAISLPAKQVTTVQLDLPIKCCVNRDFIKTTALRKIVKFVHKVGLVY